MYVPELRYPLLRQVAGDVVCDKVIVRDEGKVFGNITATSITIGPQVCACVQMSYTRQYMCEKRNME